MADGIYTSLSGALADAKRVEMISHNLANISTAGFQQMKLSLSATKGAAKNEELTFAQVQPIQIDHSPGPLRATGNPLDISLAEKVYMEVQDSGNQAYMRGGSLLVRSDGTLVSSNGRPVMGNNGVVKVPADAASLVIGSDGTVSADGQTVGKLKLVEFPDLTALENTGGVYVYRGRGAPEEPTGARPVMPGYIEESNMNVLKGMTDLISAQRSYEASTRMIRTHGEVEKVAAKEIAGRL